MSLMKNTGTELFYFNPIIGLILTSINNLGQSLLSLFQSHYRSDFNANMIVKFDKPVVNFNPIIGLILT